MEPTTIRGDRSVAELQQEARHHALRCALQYLDDRGELDRASPEEACAIAAKFEAYLTAPGKVFTDGKEWWISTSSTGTTDEKE